MKAKKPASKASKTPTPRTPAKSSAAKAESAAPKAKPKKSATRPKPAAELPAILFEGDQPAAPPVSGPGEKFTLGPTPPEEHFAPSSELPEAYGTKRLFLTARDPHWLYANWDLTREQQSECNQQSVDGHLILRIFGAANPDRPVTEIHVHPESRHWFAHVEGAGQKYTAELGYYGEGRKWASVAESSATFTPPETVSFETTVEFATISVEVPFATLLKLVKEAVVTHRPLAQALEELRQAGHPGLPAAAGKPIKKWTPEQERALAGVVSMDQVRRVWIGSLEITELIRRQLEREVSSLGVSQFGWPTSPGGVSSISSPFGGPPPGAKGFWFNVNAELIIYGATEPDATVTIGGRRIKLRPDGSFTYRFALPDGKYDLPAVAVSADETDARAAELKFMRATSFLGDVGAHPQDPALKLPTPDNV